MSHHGSDYTVYSGRVLTAILSMPLSSAMKIDKAGDHEGTMLISWREHPREEDMNSAELAWGDQNEYWLEYIMPDGIVLDVQIGVHVRTPR